MAGDSNAEVNSQRWGAFELSLFFCGSWLLCIVFNRFSGSSWFGEYPYSGACAILVLVNIPIAFNAPTGFGKLIRFVAPLVFIYLFYAASSADGFPIDRLQARLGLPHFLLVFFCAFIASIFTSGDGQQLIEDVAEHADVSLKPLSAEDNPFDRIVGQNHVIAPLTEISDIARSGIRVGKRNAPHAVLLFLGPTGVGKTEAARSLAEAVYGSAHALIRFDMGQFTDSSQANRFYGPPPGYIGSEQGGQLTRAVLKMPKSVVLLDEMEKAHSQIWDTFLPVFDEGYIVDGSTNQKVDMTNTIIVLTSNLLAAESNVAALSPSELKERVQATGVLRPELLGRINEILVFNPLSKESIIEILHRRMEAALWSLSDQGISLSVSEEEIVELSEQLEAAKFGVRQIDDVVRKFLRRAIAEHRDTTVVNE